MARCSLVLCFVALIAPVASCIECMAVNSIFFFAPSLFWLKLRYIFSCVLYTICFYYNSTSFRRLKRGEKDTKQHRNQTKKRQTANKQKKNSTDEKPRDVVIVLYRCRGVRGKSGDSILFYSLLVSQQHHQFFGWAGWRWPAGVCVLLVLVSRSRPV